MCVALICSFNNIKLAAILGVIAIAYAVLNMKGRKEFKNKLNRIKDKEEFFRQLAAPDTLELKDEQLIVANHHKKRRPAFRRRRVNL